MTYRYPELSRWAFGSAYDVLSQLEHRAEDTNSPRSYQPAVDIVQSESAFHLTVDLPGVDPAKVEVEVAEGQLHLRGERGEAAGEGRTLRRRERGVGKFERTFSLPKNTDVDSISVRAVHGVLEITIPLEKPSRRILPVASVAAESSSEQSSPALQSSV